MLGGMCVAIEYVFNEQRYIATADTQASALPIQVRGGALMLVPWGARGQSAHGPRSAPTQWPPQPWIELAAIKRKALADCDPRPIRILAVRFMVFRKVDAVTLDHWVTLRDGEWLQGALVRWGPEMAVYVVTVDPPEGLDVLSPWPRVVKTGSRPRVGNSRLV
jgi:hypothetical protein